MAEIDYSQIEFGIEFLTGSASNNIYFNGDYFEVYSDLWGGWTDVYTLSTPTAAGTSYRFRLKNGVTLTSFQWPMLFCDSADITYKMYGNIKSLYAHDMTTVSDVQPFQVVSLTTWCDGTYTTFDWKTTLVDAENLILPFTTLCNYGYNMMFYECTSLINAPELPATTLAPVCYTSMFEGCTSLINAPELPATTLTPTCYERMFYGCTSLINAPELPATTLTGSCYAKMFYGCTSLINAPELPATTLISSCYLYMFTNCSALNKITVRATDISSASRKPTTNWLLGVASSGDFYGYSSAGWSVNSATGIPSGWTFHDLGTLTEYTVNWYADNTLLRSDVYESGTSITTGPTAPTKTGYTFSGWSVELPYTVESDVDIHAVYTVNSYSIYWKIDDEVIQSSTYNYGETITATNPDAPVRDGYTFKWDSTLPSTMPANDIYINGVYTANSYTISWTAFGEVIQTARYNYGETITSTNPDAPEKQGYVFDGWVPELPSTMPAENLIITAVYTGNSYTISWVVDGEVILTANYNYGETITSTNPDAPEKPGYVFYNWSPELPSTMPAENLIITAVYIVIDDYIITNTLIAREQLVNIADSSITRAGNILPTQPMGDVYTFIYNEEIIYALKWHVKTPNGEYTPTDMHYRQAYSISWKVDDEVYNTTYSLPNVEINSITPPEKEHYTFVEWSGLPSLMPENNISVAAIYKQTTFSIEYLEDGVITSSIYVAAGAEIPPYTSEKQGYKTVLVSTDTETYDVMPEKNLQFYVMYIPNNYKIYFQDEAGNTLYTYTFAFNSTVNVNPTAPEKTGYTFSYWDNLPTTMPMGDVYCTPVYTEALYTLTYYVDGVYVHSVQLHYGNDIPGYTPEVPAGYTFTGWIGLPSNNRMPSENLSVSTELIQEQFFITWIIDGEVVQMDGYNVGDIITEYRPSARDGYTFSWWDSEVPSTMPAENLTFSATWTANLYTIEWYALGSLVNRVEQYYGETVDSFALDMSDEKYENYTFNGWIGMPADGKVPSYNLSLYADLRVSTYAVNWYADGVLLLSTAYVPGDMVESGPAIPEKDGYIIVGWDTELPFEMPQMNVDINAVYEEAEEPVTGEYNLTYLDEQGYGATKTYYTEYFPCSQNGLYMWHMHPKIQDSASDYTQGAIHGYIELRNSSDAVVLDHVPADDSFIINSATQYSGHKFMIRPIDAPHFIGGTRAEYNIPIPHQNVGVINLNIMFDCIEGEAPRPYWEESDIDDVMADPELFAEFNGNILYAEQFEENNNSIYRVEVYQLMNGIKVELVWFNESGEQGIDILKSPKLLTRAYEYFASVFPQYADSIYNIPVNIELNFMENKVYISMFGVRYIRELPLPSGITSNLSFNSTVARIFPNNFIQPDFTENTEESWLLIRYVECINNVDGINSIRKYTYLKDSGGFVDVLNDPNGENVIGSANGKNPYIFNMTTLTHE